MLLILIRVDSQIWDADLRKKARIMKKFKPVEFGLDQHLCLDPSVEFTQAYLKNSIRKRATTRVGNKNKMLKRASTNHFEGNPSLNRVSSVMPEMVVEEEEYEESDEEP